MAEMELQGLHILLVDDDASVRRTLQALLEHEGCRVTLAEGGQAGIKALREAERRGDGFAAVLTDWDMPGVDGHKVARAAKQVRPPVPVVLLSGWGTQLLTGAAVPVEVDRVIGKPPEQNELRETLAMLMRKSAQTGLQE